MAIVVGFDVHRAQITFDALDLISGEIHRGRIPATREAVRKWVKRFDGEEVDVALEAGTGWLFVCEELARLDPLKPGGALVDERLSEPGAGAKLLDMSRRDPGLRKPTLGEQRAKPTGIGAVGLRPPLGAAQGAGLGGFGEVGRGAGAGIGGVPERLKSAAGREFPARRTSGRPGFR